MPTLWQTYKWFIIKSELYRYPKIAWIYTKRATCICIKCWDERDRIVSTQMVCKYCKYSERIFDRWDYIDIALSNWWFTKIDKEDLEKVRNNLWYKTIRNSVESRIWDTLVKLHRLVMWSKDSSPIDHINRDTTDNRKINLRLCTQSENNRNIWKKKNWTSKYKYVYKHSSIWIWRVSYKWKKYYKSFKYELDAALWADWLVNSFWDKFKTTNKSLWLL